MNYEEAVAYIEDIPRFTTKNSLDHTRECLRRLGDPQRKFRVIHVAGTNGKGSTCAFITSVLREAGYSCGLFTSPHLVEINERFQINEEVIDDDTFLRAFEKVKKLSDELVAEGSYHPTYFETLLLMGMVIFAEAGVDYVTLETGLGGRLDATTAVENPAACVITSISLDHMQYLGNPLPGDYLYCPDYSKISRTALHSYRLAFCHPITRKPMDFYAPLPTDMAAFFQ